MPKPDYAALFAQYEVETDPAIRAQLWDLIYDFTPPDPLPEGETIEDYLLTDAEKELFGYVLDDYVVPNPGTLITDSAQLFVSAGYVLDGYINIESNAIPPYVLAGYVDENYIVLQSSVGDFVAYVGEYYNDLGETT
jgi:hypothetical protein